MTYCADNDIYLAFGRSNVRKWADVDNNNVVADIEARLLWARTAAYAELNDRLRTSPYQFPLTDEPYPDIVIRMEASLAGVLLYESRGITDTNQVTGAPIHALAWHRKRVEEFCVDLKTRRITLDVTPPIDVTVVPAVVNDHDTDEDVIVYEEDNPWYP